MMNKVGIVVMALLLGACSSTTPKIYYQLPSQPLTVTTTPRVTDTATAAPRTLWIARVTLADYLLSSGLVYQTSDVRYVIASNNVWASPLDQQLQQSLQSSLNARLPGWVVSLQPVGNSPATLNVTVKSFHGRFDGKAVIEGEWTLNTSDRVIRHPFSVVLPQPDDGYDALVKTLAQGWQHVAQSIADQVQQAG